MKLSGLLNLSGKEWANKLQSLDGEIYGVSVAVIEEKDCVPKKKLGTYQEVTVGYHVRFITTPETSNGFKSVLATLDIDASKNYRSLDLNFQIHWEPQKHNLIDAIYRRFDARLKNKQ